MLDKRGFKSVKIHTAPGSMSRFTVAMTITASGKKLPDLVIFKGTKTGRITKNKLPTFKQDLNLNGINSCQLNFWIDKEVMHLWIQEVFKFHLQNAPPGVHSVILLNLY